MLFDAKCVVCAGPQGPVCDPCAGALQPAVAPHVDGIDSCRVGFVLDDRARSIIAALKYRRQRCLAPWLGAAVAHLVPRCADAIVCIPATPARRRSRGFDQALEIADALSKTTSVPTAQILARSRHDERQTGRSRSERQHGPDLIARLHAPPFVVLVDDVVTTGSSMRVAALALRRAGAERVVGVAIAATPLRRDGCLRSPAIASIIRGWT